MVKSVTNELWQPLLVLLLESVIAKRTGHISQTVHLTVVKHQSKMNCADRLLQLVTNAIIVTKTGHITQIVHFTM